MCTCDPEVKRCDSVAVSGCLPNEAEVCGRVHRGCGSGKDRQRLVTPCEWGALPHASSNFRSNMHTPESRARAYTKIKRLRQEWLIANGPCTCGSWESLEVHHVDPATKVSHRIWSWSKEKREEELKKCMVLCHDCHLEETTARRRCGHGHVATYKKRGCRCDLCRAAKSVENAKRIR